jgi:WD40 repeat protein/tRNA A-37 threonylcarbamoyl transferase component Bud32
MQSGYLLRNRYRIEKLLSESGGFGKTYIATDEDFPGKPRRVVKHIQPQSNDPEELKLDKKAFESEAMALAMLGEKTDRIPTLYSYFEESGDFYLVQEFIEGKTLTEEIRNRKLSEAETLEILQEILIGLEEVHAGNKIHRDLKPDNIIRRAKDNKLVLIDFGAVKKAVQHGNNLQISQTIGIGTKGYMPFEQGLGEPKFASDIYAVGAIALQCLTGVRPSNLLDENTYQFTWRHLCQVSTPMDNLLSKMVELMPANRYANANEAKKALDDLLITPVSPPPVQPKPTAQPVIPQPSPFNNSPSTTKINRPVKTAAPPIPVIINNPTPAQPIKSPVQSVTPQTSSPDRRKFLKLLGFGSVGAIGMVTISKILESTFDKSTNTLSGHADQIHSVAISPNGKIIVSGSRDSTIKVWELATGNLIRTLSAHGVVMQIAISPDGKFIISASADNTIKVWSLTTGKLINNLIGHSGTIGSVAVSPNSQIIVSGSDDETMKIWSLTTGKLIHNLPNGNLVHSVAISPDGKKIVTGGFDETKIWQLSTGEILHSILEKRIHSVAITPDGQFFVTGGGENNNIKLWSLSSGELIRTLDSELIYTFSVAVSPDSRTVVGGGSNTIKIWKLSTGKLINTINLGGTIFSVAISPDGKTLASASDKTNTIKLWKL